MSDVYKNCPAFENDRFLLRFSYDDGVIDVEPIRDEARILTGLKQSSDADFNARTKEQETLKAELEKAGIMAGSGSFEHGNLN